ncbi:MAG TPA: hypothetical protein VHM90_01450, partial [Phycisphaerae bacterium]|nr:hypothetical protein [Phycisphaerae bacterium]
MLLFGTLALGIALGGRGTPAQGLLAGLLLGLAVGCKMTAGVFFALPVALIFALRAFTEPPHWKALALATSAAVLVYAPWAVRAAVSSGGNPLFPVAAQTLGSDHWTAEQVSRFAKGHSAPGDASVLRRARALAENSLFDSQWSVQISPLLHEDDDATTRPAETTAAETRNAESATATPSPSATSEPWWRRLGILWWGLPLALACAFIAREGRGLTGLLFAVLALQLLAWMFATHLQARFLLPAAVPLALLAGRGVQGLQLSTEGIPISAMRIIAGTVIVLHTLFTGFLLWPEAQLLNGIRPREGQVPHPLAIGDVTASLANVAASVEHPAPGDNVPLKKVLLVGDSRAWMYVGDVAYSTVFDGDLFVRQLADPTAEAAWLRSQGIVYVLINWAEIARFRATYGFEGTMSIEEMKSRVAALESAGIAPVEGTNSYEILRVK